MTQILEIARFALVGLAAMLTHLLVVWLGVTAGLDPLVANIVGFVVAFQASYFGHCFVTFNDDPTLRRYGRMFVVSCAGFLLNELAYYILLTRTTYDYRVALAIVLVVTALVTFLAAKLWVFRRGETKAEHPSEDCCNDVANDMRDEKEAWRQITQSTFR